MDQLFSIEATKFQSRDGLDLFQNALLGIVVDAFCSAVPGAMLKGGFDKRSSLDRDFLRAYSQLQGVQTGNRVNNRMKLMKEQFESNLDRFKSKVYKDKVDGLLLFTTKFNDVLTKNLRLLFKDLSGRFLYHYNRPETSRYTWLDWD